MIDYYEYIQSPEWKKKRDVCLAYWDNRCAICFSPDNLHVHHRTYDRLGHEQFTDLIVLCDDCHALYHGKTRMGAVSIDQAINILYAGGNHG